MRVLVTGGRDYADYRTVTHWLVSLQPTVVAAGGATGADALARHWADEYQVDSRTYPAKWWIAGKAAGPIRNQRMLDDFQPDVVLAFPGGKGTAHMVKIAKQAGVRVIEVDPPR